MQQTKGMSLDVSFQFYVTFEYCNDPRGTANSANTEFLPPLTKFGPILVKTTKDIAPDDEILVEYQGSTIFDN